MPHAKPSLRSIQTTLAASSIPTSATLKLFLPSPTSRAFRQMLTQHLRRGHPPVFLHHQIGYPSHTKEPSEAANNYPQPHDQVFHNAPSLPVNQTASRDTVSGFAGSSDARLTGEMGIGVPVNRTFYSFVNMISWTHPQDLRPRTRLQVRSALCRCTFPSPGRFLREACIHLPSHQLRPPSMMRRGKRSSV